MSTHINTQVPLKMLARATLFMCAVPCIVLTVFMVAGALGFAHGALGVVLCFITSALVLYPYLSNLIALKDYVDDLAQDRKVSAPNLPLLASIDDLSDAVNKLHRSWERKKQQLESIIDEREILVDSIPNILIMIDASFNILRTNAAARQRFGQNLAYRNLEDIIPNELLHRAVREAYEEGSDKEIEFLLTDPDESYYRARIDHFPVRSVGGIAVIITMHNITELKRSEQMRADFVANASHEIRTPLASILGFIETLQGSARNDEKAREQFLKIMAEQATRMSALVHDLLSLSKIEMNAATPPDGTVDILNLIRNTREHLEWATHEKRMRIDLQLPEYLPLVRGEESEISQVLHNLVSNAIKYGRPETPIVVTAEVTHRFPADRHIIMQPPVIKISVQDQGEGIAKEHIPRLTERFYRVNTPGARKASGTGLGLAIVKHILHRHRGLLEVKSMVGIGSNFTIYLPVKH
jgi:two-component system phosphate regulon sensor histidine kinase PhoR